MKTISLDRADERLLELLADEAVGALSPAEWAELEGRLEVSGGFDRDAFVHVAALLDLSGLKAVEAAPDHVLDGLKTAGAAWASGRASAGTAGRAVGELNRREARVGGAESERLRLGERGSARTSDGRERWQARAVGHRRVANSAGWAVAAVLGLAWVAWFALQPTGVAGRDEIRLADLVSDPNTQTVSWQAGTDDLGRAVTGRVVWNPQLQKGFMVFSGLTANDPSAEQYQLWVFDAERDERFPVHGGVFNVPAKDSEVIVPIEPRLAVGDVAAFVVTVERPGGVWVSDRSRVAAIAAKGG